MESSEKKSVLISGASFAGLSTAFWMSKMGYDVTVVEIAGGLRRGGTPVNIMGDTIGIMKRMGLLGQVRANSIRMETMEFMNSGDGAERSERVQQIRAESGTEEYEIERDVLLDMLFEAVRDRVTFVFGDTVVSVNDTGDKVDVTFKKGQGRPFDLVFGCDGIHSVVRRCCFGEEAAFSHFLQAYFSITVVSKLLIREFRTQMYNEPGRMVLLNAYNNKTDIVLSFFSEKEIRYDYRNTDEQRRIIQERFSGTGWRTPELLDEVKRSETFYFDELCQMRMPSWTKGRVALVGDAGYCASPAAGRGGSLAIDGAAALADAFLKCNGDFEGAFEAYNSGFRPFIEQVQADVVSHGLELLLPRTEEAIRKRNAQADGRAFSIGLNAGE